ncbi:MAG: SDR family oxidoreductase [Planctomycetota bacterium]|jgi:NAD(P)-dependent dehydrogenase (short-subunit alcohol dehydrogenase family)|nr:SDR family oxidoreductase [Planctomycetota bacterium]
MDKLFDLKDRVIVVTGGLGQIGREFVMELHGRGAKVAVLNRRMPDKAAIADRYPVDSENFGLFKADITRKKELQDALAAVKERWGIPHGLVNNAGIDTQPSAPPEVSGPFEFFPEEVWREVVDINLTGTFLTCQVFGGAMAEAGRGSIVNVGSIYGLLSPIQDIYAYKKEKTGVPFIKPVAYSASKSGLTNLTHYLGTYWAKRGVRVNLLVPSGVGRDTQDAEFVKNYTERMPIGRMARADEYNGAVVFLLADASIYMTGTQLVVDGGWTAW